MWPILLDMTKEESLQHLRCLEIDAFSGLVTALRAQGNLNNEKLKLIKETGTILHISTERHKAEVRRVVNDERLNTIAYHANGERHSADDWADEGLRLIPLMPRVAPQTAYSAIADEVADTASKLNKQLPLPASTERKRTISVSPTHSTHSSNASTSEQSNKNLHLRSLGVPQEPEAKKRKLGGLGMDPCRLDPMSHLMAPPKISKIQQIYRQKSKTRLKEQLVKMKPEVEKTEYILPQVAKPQPLASQTSKVHHVHSAPKILNQQPSPKFNVIHKPVANANANPTPIPSNIIGGASITPISVPITQTMCVNDEKIDIRPLKSPANDLQITNSHTVSITPRINTNSLPAPIQSDHRLVKRTLSSKTITTTDGQKLIVVSTHSTNHSLTPTTSILQRTLTTIPFKNISMKNLDKFKIVSSANANSKKVVVRTATGANKKIIPLSQVQVLNTKGGIKVLPLGGKLLANNAYMTSTNATISPARTSKPEPEYECDERITESKLKPTDNGLVNYSKDPKEDLELEICINNGQMDKNECIDVKRDRFGAEPEIEIELALDEHDHEEEIVTENMEMDIEIGQNEICIGDEPLPVPLLRNLNDSIKDESFGSDLDIMKHLQVDADGEVVIDDEDGQELLNQLGTVDDDVHVFSDKVDLDSSLFIYGDDHEEVVIDGINDEPMEVLSAVTLDDSSFSVHNVNNITS